MINSIQLDSISTALDSLSGRLDSLVSRRLRRAAAELGSMGGTERAKVLPSPKRRLIAEKAANARWRESR